MCVRVESRPQTLHGQNPSSFVINPSFLLPHFNRNPPSPSNLQTSCHPIYQGQYIPTGSPYSLQHPLTVPNSRLGSETLVLIAEGGHKSFVVHKNLLIIQSPLLRWAVDTLSADGIFNLKSWDGETVAHFVNFLYLQTYVVPGPQPPLPTVGVPVESASNTRPLAPSSGLRDRPNDGDKDGPDSGHSCPQEANDYHNVLLGHAKVYALAQSLDVNILSSMAYHHLLEILESLHPVAQDSRVRLNAVELLAYSYAHTNDKGDPIRILASQFVALNFTAIQDLEEMNQMMRSGGQLTVDLMGKVSRRLVAGEKALDDQREITKGVTEKLWLEQANVEVLQFNKERLEKSVKDMVSDMDNSLEQLKSRVLNAGTSEARRDAIWLEIESLRSKNNRSVKALYPEFATG